MSHLKKERGFKLEKTAPGIYTVTGDILPIQLVDSRELSEEENLWLRGLSKKLDPLSLVRISGAAARQGKAAGVEAYMDVVTRANSRTVEEVMSMSKSARSLEEVLVRTGFVAKREEIRAMAIAKNLLNLGIPLETVVSATQLDAEKVKELYQVT